VTTETLRTTGRDGVDRRYRCSGSLLAVCSWAAGSSNEETLFRWFCLPVALSLAGSAARKALWAARKGRSWRRAGALQGPRQVRQERPSRSPSAPETQEDTERFVYSSNTQLCAWHHQSIKASTLAQGHSHAGTAQALLLRIRPSVSSMRPGLQRVQGPALG
jgi:hypothetical protein